MKQSQEQGRVQEQSQDDGVDALGLGQRIRECRREMSRERFAQLLGLHPNTVGKFERGVTEPTAGLIVKIAQIGNRSADWLLTGQESAATEFVGHDDYIHVPEIDVRASAGDGLVVESEGEVGSFSFRRAWLKRRGICSVGLRVVPAKGDSMEPTVKSGDVLLVDTAVDHVHVDGIYLIEQGGELRCKRLQSMLDGGVMIRSDNSRYETEIVPAGQSDMLRVVAKVVWIGGER